MSRTLAPETGSNFEKLGLRVVQKPIPFSSEMMPYINYISVINPALVQSYQKLQLARYCNPVYQRGTGLEIFFPEKVQKNQAWMLDNLINIGKGIIDSVHNQFPHDVTKRNKIEKCLIEGKFDLESTRILSTIYLSNIGRLNAVAASNGVELSWLENSLQVMDLDIYAKNNQVMQSFSLPKEKHGEPTHSIDLLIGQLNPLQSMYLLATSNIGRFAHPMLEMAVRTNGFLKKELRKFNNFGNH